MIKWTNQSKNLSREERAKILQRSLKATPYWYQFDFTSKPIDTKDEIAFDYFITSFVTNAVSTSLQVPDYPNFIVYDAIDDEGFYGLPSVPRLPLPYIVTSAKWELDASYFQQCDIQDEKIPTPVKRGSRLIGQIEGGQLLKPCQVCMSGFTSGVRNHYLDSDELTLVNASLDNDYTYDLFKIDIDWLGNVATLKNVTKNRQIENDKYPRLALAMGAKLSTSRPLTSNEFPPVITLMIEDFDYQMKLTNEPVRLELLAPCPPRSQDQSYYYFPTEYYMPPFSTLNFEISVEPPNYDPLEPVETSYELYLLTRTV